MAKFRKKPVVLEAVQWGHHKIAIGSHDGSPCFNEVPNWLSEALNTFKIVRFQDDIFVETLEGRMKCSPGNWIIKGVKGELYPCEDSIFRELYDAC